MDLPAHSSQATNDLRPRFKDRALGFLFCFSTLFAAPVLLTVIVMGLTANISLLILVCSFYAILGLALTAAGVIDIWNDKRKAKIEKAQRLFLTASVDEKESRINYLIDENRKLGRMHAGEHYSKMLLNGLEDDDQLVSVDCYVSTLNYLRKWMYYTYDTSETKGVLYISSKSLVFRGRLITFDIPLSHVEEISIGQIPKPFPVPHKLIFLRFFDEHYQEQVVSLNPSPYSTIVMPDQIDKAVMHWYEVLQRTVNSYKGAGSELDQLIPAEAAPPMVKVRSTNLGGRMYSMIIDNKLAAGANFFALSFFILIFSVVSMVAAGISKTGIGPGF